MGRHRIWRSPSLGSLQETQGEPLPVEWADTFTDPHLCLGIVDRLTFNAHIIETGTNSYWLRTIRTAKTGTTE